MKHLFSPWRMKYILKDKPQSDCVFCDALQQNDGPQNLIIARGQTAFVILNRFPYTSGHLMILPYRHVPNFELLDVTIRSEIMELLTKSTETLGRVYHPGGFNLGVNIGEAAGAGVAAHVHLHVVPRWNGDTNYMSAIGDTRVIPEDLESTFRRVQTAWNEKYA